MSPTSQPEVAPEDSIYSGLIFNVGYDRLLTTGLLTKTASGRMLEFSNYQYRVNDENVIFYGFLRVALDRRLPHLVLDAKSDNVFETNLPAYFAKSQLVDLEGDFSRYFDLYVPEEYGRDVRYILTPDIMKVLIDEARTYDMEIVNDQLFVYVPGGFAVDGHPQFQRLVTLATRLSDELNAQVDYYSDERVGDRTANVVASQGRRLKAGLNWFTVAVVATMIYAFAPSITAYEDLPDYVQQLVTIVMVCVILVLLLRLIISRHRALK